MSVDLLADEAKDPESTLASGGEAKVRLVSELLERIRGTLEAQRDEKKYTKLENSWPGLKRFYQNPIRITTLYVPIAHPSLHVFLI